MALVQKVHSLVIWNKLFPVLIACRRGDFHLRDSNQRDQAKEIRYLNSKQAVIRESLPEPRDMPTGHPHHRGTNILVHEKAVNRAPLAPQERPGLLLLIGVAACPDVQQTRKGQEVLLHRGQVVHVFPR